MANSLLRRPAVRVSLVILLLFILFAVVWNVLHSGLPSPSSDRYRQMVSQFYAGVMGLEVGDAETTPQYVHRAVQIVPEEPAAWANLGLFQLRQNDLTQAQVSLAKAHDLAPDDGQIELLLGLLAQKQGKFAEAVAHVQNAVQRDPANVRARWTLVTLLQQQGGATADPDSIALLKAILERQPDNLFVQIELARLAAKTGDIAAANAMATQIAARVQPLSAEIRAQVAALQTKLRGGDPRAAVTDFLGLRNLLSPVPLYQNSGAQVKTDEQSVGTPLDHFVRLLSPPDTPAPPDTATTFAASPLVAGQWTALATAPSVDPSPDKNGQSAGSPALVVRADGKTVAIDSSNNGTISLPFPGGPSANPPTSQSLLLTDWSNDFQMGLVLAGAGGIKLYRQGAGGPLHFDDVTDRAKLPPAIANGAYTGAWAADVDMDGDLDLVLGTPSGVPLVLQNNGEGTFTPIHPFPGKTGLRAFCWADFDNDGANDAAYIDGQRKLQVYQNRRNGLFEAWPIPNAVPQVAAIAAADLTRRGTTDLIVWGIDGSIRRLARNDTEDGWNVQEIVQASAPPTDGTARLVIADLDNNGAQDIIATSSAGTQIWLGDTHKNFVPLAAPSDARSVVLDETGTGNRLDLLGLTTAGAPVRLANNGVKKYGVQRLRFYAAKKADQRNNSFGVGMLASLRAGLLYETTVVNSPVVRLGLGDNKAADYIRIRWTNGSPQGECFLKPNETFSVTQRLVGSCPWLIADNGKEMQFVTDLIWRSPLGLRINAQVTAGVAMTADAVKIRGDQLAARDGAYHLSVTADLWETHFFDYLSLETVDHPVGTDIYVDERFAIPPPPQTIHLMSRLHPVRKATDDLGTDVTATVKDKDGQYLDTFGRGDHQGITRDHWVTLDLGDTPPNDKSLWLLAYGWIHPTDSSINIAISQGHHAPPQQIRLEVPNSKGGWRIARSNQGFPEGKNKTCLFNLSGLFPPGIPHQIRLRTNLEIYWDQIGWATELPAKQIKTQTATMQSADLQYRGFSIVRQANQSSPELPDYAHLHGTGPQWLDLIGFYTRFGDVRQLLRSVDDRYVIMNAGDELSLRFAAAPPPPPGWTRDFIMHGDGWVKDGNLNTTFSKTVLPLPTHAHADYAARPGRLQDDPVYKQHKADWLTYQTRWVSPRAFRDALMPGR